MIEPIKREQLRVCLDILRRGYEDAAVRFGMTEENCPYRGRTRLPYEVFEAEFDGGCMMYGYVRGGETVGFLSLSVSGRGMYVNDIAVLPEHQNRGFGGELMRFAIEKAKELTCEKISLGMVHENVRLRSWYEKAGFITVELRKFEKVSYTVATMELVL